MSIFSILNEEYDRLLEVDEAYQAAIARELQGSPQIKRLRQKNYLYLAYRKGPKVVFKYIGALDSEKSKQALESIQKRKRLEKLLKEARQDLGELKKIAGRKQKTVRGRHGRV